MPFVFFFSIIIVKVVRVGVHCFVSEHRDARDDVDADVEQRERAVALFAPVLDERLTLGIETRDDVFER